MIIPIILSGGNGTRLWPLSNNKKPKQFIKLINDNTLFTETILRFKNKDIYTEPIILSNIKYNELILEELKNNNLYKATIFFEPISRNTAPAIASVVNYLAYKRPNDIALFLPSDAYIDDVDRFTEFLIEGEGLAQNDKLVCFGIKPTYPETGYGYIKSSEKIGNNSFIGSNTIIIAPINIGNNTMTAAGSVITNDVIDGAIAISRSEQKNLDQGMIRYRKKMGEK